MNATERIVLKELTKSLKESTETSWEIGYLDDWSKYARKMKSVIKTVVPVLEKLVDETVNKDES